MADEEHHPGWIEAVIKEIKGMEDNDTWEEVPINSVPKGHRILPGTWVFHHKRMPDGTVSKLKGAFRDVLKMKQEQMSSPLSHLGYPYASSCC